MKLYIYQIKKSLSCTILCLVVGSAFFLNSCKKEETGAPVITRVRFIDPDVADSSVVSASLGQWLVIQGSNFNDLQEVYFNNLKTSFNPTLVTGNNIVILVSDNTPTLATDSANAINELKVVTKHGVAVFTLTILPPPPVLDSLSCEFAKAGETLTIYGKYFYFVESVTFPGGIQGTDIVTESTGTTCKVKVPEGITEGGKIMVKSQSGNSTIGRTCNFNDTTSIFFNCENGAAINLQGTNGVKFYNTTDNPEIPSCLGKYALSYADEIAPGVSWMPATAFESNYLGSKFTYPDYPLTTLGSDLELRFEVFIKNTWNSGFYEMAFLSDSATSAWKNAYSAMVYPPANKTKTWITVRVPLTKFTIQNKDNSDADLVGNSPATYAQIKGHGFNFNFKNTTLTLSPFNVAMDNFRIVKIN
jgi:hypothetical protein